MEINDVLILDTETTGIPDRAAKWDVDYMEYPHVVQIAWIFRKADGVIHSESHYIRPDGWEIPDDVVAVHGITTEYAIEHGESFSDVVEMLIDDCREAKFICGHNIHFDTGIIKANILRELGLEYFNANDVETALFKGKRIDTMRSSMKWVDARNSWGKLKFPNLGELYARCFPGETFPAHDALEDCRAVARCLPILIENGSVELKIKEYPEPAPDDFKTIASGPGGSISIAPIPKTAINGPISQENIADDKLPVFEKKTPEIANSAKITIELLNQNEF